jgi:hypothetical protein
MPQLDLFSFFSQFIWFVLVFLFIYFRVVGVFLPKISEILKFRLKLLNSDLLKLKNLKAELFSLQAEEEKFIFSCLDVTSSEVSVLLDSHFSASKKAFDELNKTVLFKSNQSFLLSVVNFQAGQFVLGVMVLTLV